MSCLTDSRDLDKIVTVCHSFKPDSGLTAAILDLSLPVRSDSIVAITVGLLDPEKIGLAVGIALSSCVQMYI